MDPDKDIAEERLLRVIEKGQARTASAVAMGSPKGINLFKWIRSWLAQNYSRPIGREVDPTLKILQTVSALVWFALACFGVYFGLQYLAEQKQSFHGRAFKARQAASSSAQMDAARLEPQLKDENHYVEAVQNPNPFTGTSEEVVVQEEAPVRGPSPAEKLAQMAKGLVIVGINRGAVPDAIIENTEQKKTFFVKAGDMINDMQVKEVRRDTVVLTLEGEDVEIA